MNNSIADSTADGNTTGQETVGEATRRFSRICVGRLAREWRPRMGGVDIEHSQSPEVVTPVIEALLDTNWLVRPHYNSDGTGGVLHVDYDA